MLQIQFKFGRCDVAARNDHDDDLNDDDDLFDPATFGDSITRYHTISDEILDKMNRDKIPRAYDLTARRER